MKRLMTLCVSVTLLVVAGFSNLLPVQARGDTDLLYQEIETEPPTPPETPLPTATSTSTPVPTSTPVIVVVTATPEATATSQPSYARPLLNLTSYSYDTNNVYPTGYFTLDSTFKNVGQQRAYNILITYSSNSVQPQESGGVGFFSSLASGESAESSQYFAVNSSVSSTPVTITVAVEYKDVKGTSYSQTFIVSINVYGYGSSTSTYTPTPNGRPSLVVSAYTTDVNILQPGTSFNLTMEISNDGPMAAYNVRLSIGSQNTGSSGTTTSNTNFLPLGSSNVQVVGDLGMNQVVQVQQAFVVNTSTDPGAYPLTLYFTYKDSYGNSFTDEQIITLLVYMVPSIEISFYEDPGTFSLGEEATLPIQVINKGSDALLLGNISVSMEGATLSNSTLFVGSLESGGIFSLDVDITPGISGNLPVNIILHYQDNFAREQVIEQVLSITVEGQTGGMMPQMNSTEQAAMQLSGSDPADSGTESIWQIILRVIKGLIGFGSAPSSSSNDGNMMRGAGFGLPSMTTVTP